MLNLVFGTWFGSIPAVGFAVCFAFVLIAISRCGGSPIAIKGASRSRGTPNIMLCVSFEFIGD